MIAPPLPSLPVARFGIGVAGLVGGGRGKVLAKRVSDFPLLQVPPGASWDRGLVGQWPHCSRSQKAPR